MEYMSEVMINDGSFKGWFPQIVEASSALEARKLLLCNEQILDVRYVVPFNRTVEVLDLDDDEGISIGS